MFECFICILLGGDTWRRLHMEDYTKLWHIYFFLGKIYLFQMGGKPYNFPISSYKRIPPEETGRETKRGACTFPAQKSSSEGRRPSTLRIDGAENHVAFFSSWKMVSDEWRTRGELLLAKQKVHYSLQQWMPLSYISCWILFLQGPHLASNSLSHRPPPPFFKNVAYSLWGSYPRKKDRGEGLDGGTGTQRGAVLEKGRGREGSPTEYTDT